jgi:hypothetical protein
MFVQVGSPAERATLKPDRLGRGSQPVRNSYKFKPKDCNDAQTDVPIGIPMGAMCVQRLDDSLNSAIHINYRVSLRSSSMREPRDPLLKVLISFKKCFSDCKEITSLVGAAGRLTVENRSGKARPAAEAKGFCFHKGFKTLTGEPDQRIGLDC